MKILIEIHCETKSELFAHLWRIKTQLKRELKNVDDNDEIEKDFELEDSNCYGEHEVYGFVNDDIQMAIDESQVMPNRKQGVQVSDTTKADSIK